MSFRTLRVAVDLTLIDEMLRITGCAGSPRPNGIPPRVRNRGPGLQVREGMTSKSLKPGDEIKATINPLHSGAEGGSYQPLAIKFKDGTPVAVPK